ncbi:hypothetical protein [Winogradskyella sp. PG-2]|uniref:hypothetical protein n=1 Tax=Winogradskyella sp. PG-2 TaxID=754409 RepID=UPI00045863BB|nr:hypothetical protein [Winogradskyella sp. PG-2]BAO74892.1 hypothetical protein WPG_0662 [Winogradskyella sp. PG-2]
MKKLITLCLFVFAMLLGTESAIAQTNKKEVHAQAAQKTEALRKYVKFNDTQRDQVYQAVKEYTQATLDLKKVAVVEEVVVEKIEKLLETKMQGILTDEQFERYKTFTE